MKARLMHLAAPWLIALGMLVGAPAHADRPTARPACPPAAQATPATPVLAWDRVGAPMQGLA